MPLRLFFVKKPHSPTASYALIEALQAIKSVCATAELFVEPKDLPELRLNVPTAILKRALQPLEEATVSAAAMLL